MVPVPSSSRDRHFSFYLLCFSIAETAAACCLAASCPAVYVWTARVTPKLMEMRRVNPKTKRVNELRGDGDIALSVYTHAESITFHRCAATDAH